MTSPTTPWAYGITLASGAVALVNDDGLVIEIQPKCPICSAIGHGIEDCYPDEGPSCSICDGLGHGYPGGPPCPLEVDDRYVGSQEEARERYLEGLAEQRQQDRLDARDEAKEWGGEDLP